MLRKRKNTVMHLSDLKKSQDKMQNKAAPEQGCFVFVHAVKREGLDGTIESDTYATTTPR